MRIPRRNRLHGRLLTPVGDPPDVRPSLPPTAIAQTSSICGHSAAPCERPPTLDVLGSRDVAGNAVSGWHVTSGRVAPLRPATPLDSGRCTGSKTRKSLGAKRTALSNQLLIGRFGSGCISQARSASGSTVEAIAAATLGAHHVGRWREARYFGRAWQSGN